MSRWIRDARSLIDLILILIVFILLGGVMHLLTGRVVSATIAGAALGFLVSESARWRQDRTEDRWVRRALRLEFDHNLTSLASFWNGANPVHAEQTASLTAVQTQFFFGLLPPWNRALWASQVGHLGSALTDEEISASMRFQSEHDLLIALRDRVISRANGNPAALDVDPADWEAIETLVTTMLREGNPIVQ